MGSNSFTYGTVPTVSVTKNVLKEANKTAAGTSYWKDLENNAMYQLKAAEQAAKGQLSKGISDTYLTGTKTKQNVYGSDIIQSQQNALAREYDLAMQEAYNSYKNAYNDTLSAAYDTSSAAYDTYSKAYSNIDTALTEQSQNTNALAKKGYEYMSWLNDTSPDALSGSMFDFLYNGTDENGARGDFLSYSKLNETLYNNDGSLNEKGQMFYDMIFNPGAINSNVTSFGDYLSTNDAELSEWAHMLNQYDASGLTNLDYVKKSLMGIDRDVYDVKNYQNLYGDVQSKLIDAQNRTAAGERGLDENGNIIGAYDGFANDYEIRMENGKYRAVDVMSNMSFDNFNKAIISHTEYSKDAPNGYGTGGEQDAWVRKVWNAAREGKITDGTIIDFNEGAGARLNYVYFDGNFYEVDEDYSRGAKHTNIIDERTFDDYIAHGGRYTNYSQENINKYGIKTGKSYSAIDPSDTYATEKVVRYGGSGYASDIDFIKTILNDTKSGRYQVGDIVSFGDDASNYVLINENGKQIWAPTEQTAMAFLSTSNEYLNAARNLYDKSKSSTKIVSDTGEYVPYSTNILDKLKSGSFTYDANGAHVTIHGEYDYRIDNDGNVYLAGNKVGKLS